MSQATVRRLALLEPVVIFILIMSYIWSLRYAYGWFWLGILALMVVSHALRREDADRLGFRTANLRECLARFAPAVAFFALVMLSAGLLLQTTRPIAFDKAIASWAAYLPWGIFQQYILNGYFLNRFDAAVSRRSAPMVARRHVRGGTHPELVPHGRHPAPRLLLRDRLSAL